MKQYQVHQRPNGLSDSKGVGFPARTFYPTAPGSAVLQGKFLLSIGETAGANASKADQEDARIIADGVVDMQDLHQKHNKPLKTFRYQAATGEQKESGIEEVATFPAVSTPSTSPPALGLRGIALDEELEIIAHGRFDEDVDGTPHPVTHYGGLTAQELADYLIVQGLPEGYKGNIRLTGCATGFGGNQSYVNAVAYKLKHNMKGWQGDPSVFGFIGSTHLEKGNNDSRPQLYATHPSAIRYRIPDAQTQLDAVLQSFGRNIVSYLIQRCSQGIAQNSSQLESANIATAANLLEGIDEVSSQIDRLVFPLLYLDDFEAETHSKGEAWDEKGPSPDSQQLYPLGKNAMKLAAIKTVLEKATHLLRTIRGHATVPNFADDKADSQLIDELVSAIQTTEVKLDGRQMKLFEIVGPDPQPQAQTQNAPPHHPNPIQQPPAHDENPTKESAKGCCIVQ